MWHLHASTLRPFSPHLDGWESPNSTGDSLKKAKIWTPGFPAFLVPIFANPSGSVLPQRAQQGWDGGLWASLHQWNLRTSILPWCQLEPEHKRRSLFSIRISGNSLEITHTRAYTHTVPVQPKGTGLGYVREPDFSCYSKLPNDLTKFSRSSLYLEAPRSLSLKNICERFLVSSREALDFTLLFGKEMVEVSRK